MRRWPAILWSLICLLPRLLAAQEVEAWRIESEHPVEYDLETGRMVATNGVTVRYRGAILSARRAMLDQVAGQVEAEGDVRLEREGRIWVGEKLLYNFNTGRMSGEGFKTGSNPYFAQGQVLVADQPAGVYVLADGAVTTDDYDPPAYRIQTKTLVIVPGEYVEARHATLRLGNTPVFYFPYFRRTLKERGNHWTFTPGYRSLDGVFLLTTYHWYAKERLDGAVHLDGRMKRGVGVGPDLNWDLGRVGQGTFKSYYIRDQDPGEGDFEEPIDPDRYRFWVSHLARPRTNLTVRGVLRYQSDPWVVRDFFESEYVDNVQPSTFVEAHQAWSNFSLDALVQPRVHDFYETVERLPDIKLTGLRQQIGGSPLFYESESTMGYYEREFAYDLIDPFAAARADTYHQILLPRTFFNWLNVTPRAGGRFTYYTEAHGTGATTSEETRWVFNTGAEVSTKASRVWPGIRNRFWDLDGLRHIIMPSVNYAYVPNPSPGPNQLPQFDYVVPSTRLLPIEYPDFNAIDGIDGQNVIRFGLRNKFQTKRNGRVENLVHWALVMDWRLDPNAGQETFSDIYSDIDIKPFSWLTLTSETRYDLNEHRWNEANHMITLTPNDRWSWSVGQRYLRNDPSLGPLSGNRLFFSTVYYRVNENWGLRMYHRYNAEDSILEEQSYTLYRDLRSWTAALTVRIREDLEGPLDVTGAVTFSLKAFPRFGLGDDVNRPTLLLGR